MCFSAPSGRPARAVATKLQGSSLDMSSGDTHACGFPCSMCVCSRCSLLARTERKACTRIERGAMIRVIPDRAERCSNGAPPGLRPYAPRRQPRRMAESRQTAQDSPCGLQSAARSISGTEHQGRRRCCKSRSRRWACLQSPVSACPHREGGFRALQTLPRESRRQAAPALARVPV